MSPRLDTATKTEVVSVAATALARGQASWFRGELSPLLDYVADFLARRGRPLGRRPG